MKWGCSGQGEDREESEGERKERSRYVCVS